MANWTGGLAVVALVAIVTLIVLALAGRRQPLASSQGRPLVLVAGRALALAFAVLTLAGGAGVVVMTLVGDSVDVSLPVQEIRPAAHPWVTFGEGPTASIVGGGFTHADVLVAGLSAGTRALLAAGHAIQALTLALLAAVVALLCHRMLQRSPFRPALSRALTLSAVTIALGGVVWQVFLGIGSTRASHEALSATSWQTDLPGYDFDTDPLRLQSDDPAGLLTTGLPQAAVGVTIDFWPLILGLALAALAIVFRYGERLQRDTEGLV